MEKLDKELIKKLSKDLMFELSEEEVNSVHEASFNFLSQVKVLQSIDVSDVEVMSYPFETDTVWMREDIADHQIDQELAFKNAPRIEGDYFEIVKVVKK